MDLILHLCSSCSSHQYIAKKATLSNSYKILKSFMFQCLFGKENKKHWTLLTVTMHPIWIIFSSHVYFVLPLFIANFRAKFPRDCVDCNQQARSLTDTSEDKGNGCFLRLCLRKDLIDCVNLGTAAGPSPWTVGEGSVLLLIFCVKLKKCYYLKSLLCSFYTGKETV